ncbi:tryptophan synthase subunit beta [[Clostridium] fimetarium]|uniref:Tryptophan synthase beta chain n=1 Tax=[Clostridium] fimetarium TaxID=99656 RepID=A0A1I0RAK2_9FIRM|nr:tryptophan synthase subunit beta [[Clostridium] fimetarium]SEW37277.1 tryptophan synthase beta chain/phosphoribosylanthranilate isomerase [[Clostridium] fimetarium]
MSNSYYGEFGGQFVSESLMNTLHELEDNFEKAIIDPLFISDYDYYMKEYVGRENPLYLAEKLSAKYGTKIYLKREDLNHTGAHKINNVIGQLLLARRMGKTKVLAETGAGQHGVATATGAALFDMECTIFMGEEDMKRQELNVFRMEMLGAKVVCVKSGSRTLKDATNEAIRTWAERAEDTCYIIGSALGPYPYPKMVKEFQKIISVEARKQVLEKEGRLPDVVMACVGGGSNAIGMFAEFINDKEVKLIGVEAGGLGVETGKHASAMALGRPGVLHGMRSYLLQDEDGNVELAHSISAGLDYPGVGPEHAYLRDTGRVQYVNVTDDEAMTALLELCKMEGIIPAIESAHALAYIPKITKEMTEDQILIICLSGRGDKDVQTVAAYLKGEETNK